MRHFKPPYPTAQYGPNVRVTTEWWPTGELKNSFSTGGSYYTKLWGGTYSSTNTQGFNKLSASQRRQILKPLTWESHHAIISSGNMIRVTFQLDGTKTEERFLGQVFGMVPLVSTGIPMESPTTHAHVRSMAISNCLSNIGQNKVNLAQAFAERKQTVDLLSKSVNRLASAALAIRRGKFKHAVELFGRRVPNTSRLYRHDVRPSPQNLSNHWLEFSYGWRPLISDIYGSMELLADTFYRNPPARFTGSAKDEFSYERETGYGYYEPQFRERQLNVTSRRASCVVYCTVDNAFAQKMSQTGLTNPALLAWELIPYSFVVDWFIPVGDYLQNLTATQGLNFLRGTISSASEQSVTQTVGSNGSTGNGKLAGTAGQMQHMRKHKYRQVLLTFPTPPLPRFDKDPFGVNRVLSGLALLTQAFSGRK